MRPEPEAFRRRRTAEHRWRPARKRTTPGADTPGIGLQTGPVPRSLRLRVCFRALPG
jgi:hypothetical protein